MSVSPTRRYQSEGGPGIVEICGLFQSSDELLRDRALPAYKSATQGGKRFIGRKNREIFRSSGMLLGYCRQRPLLAQGLGSRADRVIPPAKLSPGRRSPSVMPNSASRSIMFCTKDDGAKSEVFIGAEKHEEGDGSDDASDDGH